MRRLDLLQLARFGLVGAGATGVHLATVFLAERFLALPLVAVHGLGYLVAFSVSFVGHYIYTFASGKAWQRALAKFLAVSLAALLASTGVVALGGALGLPRLASLLVAAASVPVLSYLANREFVF